MRSQPPEFGLALLTVRPRAERRLDNTGPAGWRRAPQHPRALGVGGRSASPRQDYRRVAETPRVAVREVLDCPRVCKRAH